ncbi:MAG: ABC transporter ATP-binding protein [Fusobacteriaceae bacterium]
MLKVKNLNISIDNIEILKNISMTIKSKKNVGIIGPNGCGKSTILKNIYRYLKSESGLITINNISIEDYKPKELAKKMAVLAQNQNINFDFTVEEIVEMGRYAHEKSIFSIYKKEEIVSALKQVGIKNMKDRSFLTLSGGEIQRVLIARALVQKSDLLILDEPTNHLDIKYQLQIMNLIKEIDKTTLSVVHDMNIASSYCDFIYAIKNGEIIAQGTPNEIFTEQNIYNIFDIHCKVIKHPTKEAPLIIFL